MIWSNGKFWRRNRPGAAARVTFSRYLRVLSQVMVNNPDSLIFELSSIVERIDPAKLFPRAQPLEVELGCGDSTFLVEYASLNPDRNFIGVERLLGRINKLDRKGQRADLANLRGVRIESSYFL